MGYSARAKRVKGGVSGGDKIIRSLKNMETAAANVLMDAAKEGGKIALNGAIKNCPEDTGALKNSLKISEGKKTELRADVKVDYDKKLKYGTFVELGTNGRAPNPFLRNAVDENIDKINNKITEEISNAIRSKM